MELTGKSKPTKVAASELETLKDGEEDSVALDVLDQQGEPLPGGYLSDVTVPALVIVGGKSPEYMKHAQAAIVAALPNGTLRELPGERHMVRGKATVPALREF